ncbi:MAG: glucuronyl hydrolase [Bacteroidota bacterium]
MLYEHTADPTWQAEAERWTEGLETLITLRGTHDLGFMMHNSFGQGYRLTRNPAYRNVVLETSETLAERYNPTVGAIRSWGFGVWEFPVIVDNLMNLEMLYWAAANGGDASWADLATNHAQRSLREHVRPDGTTFHVVDFDTTSGEVRGKHTHQGYADASMWTRGQAWAVYGFTLTFRATQDSTFLRAAQTVAGTYLAALPEDHIPYWDFNHPAIPDTTRDASAAAITASALFELGGYSAPDDQVRYHDAAASMVAALIHRYRTEGTDNPALLLSSTGNANRDSEVDVPIIYADYYFVEALLRYLGTTSGTTS